MGGNIANCQAGDKMIKKFNTQIIMLILMFAFTATVFAGDLKVGFIKSVTGKVTIKRGETVVQATQGVPIFKCDVLITDSNSSVAIMFSDGTAFAMDESSQISIKEYLYDPESSAYAFDLFLEKGKAIYSSGRIEKLAPDAVCLTTPKATIGVRGTHFILQVE